MSVAPGRQGVIAFFVTFCVCLVALAVALNVGWVVLTLREIVPLLLGSLVFAAIITGLILNTTFLVREIRLQRAARRVRQRGHARVEDARHVDSAASRNAEGARTGRRRSEAARVLRRDAEGQRPAAASHRTGAERRPERARAASAGAHRSRARSPTSASR